MKYFILLTMFASQALTFAQTTFEQFSEQSSEAEKGVELNMTYVRENRGSFKYPDTDIAQKEKDYQRELLRRLKTAKELGAVKLDMINGNLEKAHIRLLKSRYEESFAKPILYRYLGMIHFIEGEYEKSLSFLKKPELGLLRHQDNICLLKTLNLVILDRSEDARSEWRHCKKFLIGKDGGANIWMESLLELKIAQEEAAAAAPLKGLNIENEKGDRLRLFLKLALYLNKQEIIFPRIKYLSSQAFENPRTRELLGMLYFRDLQLVKAYDLIEDLSTPNSENIKGNILLAQDKLELAYAQFKLALARKNNSQNALERIVPTAWRLNQWSEGAGFTTRLEAAPGNKDSKLALEAAFLTKDKNYQKAWGKLKAIEQGHANAQALEINQLRAFNSVMLSDQREALESADKACRQMDAFNCWLSAHLLIWEDFTLLAKRKETIIEEPASIIEEFTSDFVKDPIKETIYVDQKDIEELEDLEIQLMPETKK